MSEWRVWQVHLAADCAQAVPKSSRAERPAVPLAVFAKPLKSGVSLGEYRDGNLTLSTGQNSK